MRKAIVLLTVLLLVAPTILAYHSSRDRPDSVLNVPTVDLNRNKVITASDSYAYTGSRAVLPSSIVQRYCPPESSEVSVSSYYVGTYSQDYYDDSEAQEVRIVDVGKPKTQQPQTGGYWGAGVDALNRICDKRDYSAYYDPRAGRPEFKYYERVIGKDSDDLHPEPTIDAPLAQRLLANDARVRSITLPDYVDVTEVPFYVPPANPKERNVQYALSQPSRLNDDQGRFRFVPGYWQDRAYYYLDPEDREYLFPEERAQRILNPDGPFAQRYLSGETLTRGQRTLSDEYGDKYGKTIKAPPIGLGADFVPAESTGPGSVHDGRLFAYIRYAGKVPSYYLHPKVDPRLQQDAELYEAAYYDTMGIPFEDGVISEPTPFSRSFRSQITPEYYRAKITYINQRYAFVFRRASNEPVEYRPLPPDAEKYNQLPTTAQRILQYEQPPQVQGQRVLGGEPSRAQRRIG